MFECFLSAASMLLPFRHSSNTVTMKHCFLQCEVTTCAVDSIRTLVQTWSICLLYVFWQHSKMRPSDVEGCVSITYFGADWLFRNQCLMLLRPETRSTSPLKTWGIQILPLCLRPFLVQAKWRTACVKFLQWRFWQGGGWKSSDEAHSMTWARSWPFTPCYAGHRPLVKSCHTWHVRRVACPYLMH